MTAGTGIPGLGGRCPLAVAPPVLDRDRPASYWDDPAHLCGFSTFYGVRVGYVGDDGALVALGHPELRRVVAAFNAMARRCGFRDIFDGERDRDEPVFEQLCRSYARVWWERPYAEAEDWFMTWDQKPNDYRSFPITSLEP